MYMNRGTLQVPIRSQYPTRFWFQALHQGYCIGECIVKYLSNEDKNEENEKTS